MKRSKLLAALAVVTVLTTGCATWSTTSVDGGDKAIAGVIATTKTPAAQIVLTDQDIVDRKYTVLGDITATVNKTTVFHPSPTREMVNEEFRKKAYEMGSDAVILIRYGEVGVSLMSWGSLEGKGRAVKFSQ